MADRIVIVGASLAGMHAAQTLRREGFDGRLLLEWLCGWVIDLLRLQTSPQPPHLFNQDQAQALHRTADKLNSGVLHRYLGLVYAARGLIDGNLNPQLVLEKLLIEWRACH